MIFFHVSNTINLFIINIFCFANLEPGRNDFSHSSFAVMQETHFVKVQYNLKTSYHYYY